MKRMIRPIKWLTTTDSILYLLNGLAYIVALSIIDVSFFEIIVNGFVTDILGNYLYTRFFTYILHISMIASTII